MGVFGKILKGLATARFILGLWPTSHKKADRYVDAAADAAKKAGEMAGQVGAVLSGGKDGPEQ